MITAKEAREKMEEAPTKKLNYLLGLLFELIEEACLDSKGWIVYVLDYGYINSTGLCFLEKELITLGYKCVITQESPNSPYSLKIGWTDAR